jgi:hypothetical protein
MEENKENLRLNDLMFKALDHGIDSIREGGPLVPFVMTETTLNRFVNDRLEVATEKAEEFLANQKNEKVIALAYDGFVTIEAKKYDAIIVKAFDKDDERGIVLAQRYRPKGFLRKLQTIGNPALMGYQENPLNKANGSLPAI